MENHDAGLTGQPKLPFNRLDCLLESLYRKSFCLGRAEREGEQKLAAPGAAADRMGLGQRLDDRVGDEAAYLMAFDMRVLVLEQMKTEVARAAARARIRSRMYVPSGTRRPAPKTGIFRHS
jgi:hypothetical protein